MKVYFVSVDCWSRTEGVIPVQAENEDEAKATILEQLSDPDWYREVQIVEVNEHAPKPRLVVDNDKNEKLN